MIGIHDRIATLTRRVTMTAVWLLPLFIVGCGDRTADVPNELPLGVVDMPKTEAILRPGPTLVAGWAVDDSGVREIRVYFDGQLKGRATLDVARPDVAAAMPRYARPGVNHGWNVLVDFGMAPGSHTILVLAEDDHGATQNIGVVPVTTPR